MSDSQTGPAAAQDADFLSPSLPRRPRSVTLLGLGVLIMTGVYLARLVLALRDWSILAPLPGSSPLYLTLTGLIWMGVGALLSWGIWRPGRGRVVLPARLRRASLIYTLYFWLERLFLFDREASAAPFQICLPKNWPFLLALTGILVGSIFYILSRSKTKLYFGELYEKNKR